MKQYTPEKMVATSRYKTLFPTLPSEIQKDVYDRMRVLLEEEKQWCDAGNYKHIAQILTTIALYEILQQHGKSEPDAFRIVSEAMWGALTPKTLTASSVKSLTSSASFSLTNLAKAKVSVLFKLSIKLLKPVVKPFSIE